MRRSSEVGRVGLKDVRASARAATAAVKVRPERVEALRKEILAKAGQRARRLLRAKRRVGDDLLDRFRLAVTADLEARKARRSLTGVSTRARAGAEPVGFIVELRANTTASAVERTLRDSLGPSLPEPSMQVKPLGSPSTDTHRIFLVTLPTEGTHGASGKLRGRVGEALAAVSVTPTRLAFTLGQLRSGVARVPSVSPPSLRLRQDVPRPPAKDGREHCCCCCCCPAPRHQRRGHRPRHRAPPSKRFQMTQSGI